MSIAHALRKAAKIQEQIEKLRGQLAELLAKARAELTSDSANEVSALLRSAAKTKGAKLTPARNGAAVPKLRRGRKGAAAAAAPKLGKTARRGAARSPLAGRKRSSSPSGPLAPAVVKVLKSSNKPMSVRDILVGLQANGYVFNTPEPKKNLAARIYRLNGVKQVAAGLFGVD